MLIFSPILRVKASDPIKILLVPGHDNEVWGAQYGNIKEADMTLDLATKIFNLLKKDKKFQVYITRDSNGYTKEFADYFSLHKNEIIAFKQNAKTEMQTEISNGAFLKRKNVPHNGVNADVAVKLYGFNKWANENKIDAVVHIHFNDYPRSHSWTIGKYKGFAIYFPDSQFPNGKTSFRLASSIFSELAKKYRISTYPEEAGGLISEQKLIALGSNGTLDKNVRAALIEYGYIYEKKFRKISSRLNAYKNMANLTVAGIKKYFSISR